MGNHTIHSRIAIIALACITLFACRPEDKLDRIVSPDFNPEMALPLFKLDGSIRETLDDFDGGENISTGTDSILIILFDDQVFNEQIENDIVQIPDIPFAAIDTANKISVPFPGGEKIYKFNMTQASISADILTTADEDVEVIVIFPGITKNGIPWKGIDTLKYTGAPTTTIQINDNLAGYEFDMSDGGSDWNSLELNYFAKRISNNQSVILNQLTGSISGIQQDYIEGYFGQQNLDTVSGFAEVELIEGDLLSGAFKFFAPLMILTVNSSVGIPLRININKFLASSATDSLDLTGSIITSGFNVDAPTVANVGSFVSTPNIIDVDVSNFPDVLNIKPDRFDFEFEIEANHSGDTNDVNFLTNNSSLNMDLGIRIPFDMSITGFTFNDTTEFDGDALSNFAELTLKFVTDNGLPADINLQVYFLDSNDVILDSLMDTSDNLFESGVINADGRVIETTRHEILVPVKGDKLKALIKSKKAAARVRMSTTNNGLSRVKFFIDDGWTIQLGIIAKVDADF